MRKLLIGGVLALLVLSAYPNQAQAQTSEEMPVSFYLSVGATAALDDEAAITSSSASLRFGLATNLNKEGSWKILTEFNSINKPLKKDETNGQYVKSIDLGVQRIYQLRPRSGFFSNTAFVVRGVFDIEVNRTKNDENFGIGFGFQKKLSVDDRGRSHFTIQAEFDMLMRNDEKDDIGFYVTMLFTPFQSVL